jgi:hypothetical protein
VPCLASKQAATATLAAPLILAVILTAMSAFSMLGSPQATTSPANVDRERTELLELLHRVISSTHSRAAGKKRHIFLVDRYMRARWRPPAAQTSTLISLSSAEIAAQNDELRRAHEQHLEEEHAAEKEKEERRKARAKDERERRERAQVGPSSTLSSSSAPAPWPQGQPLAGMADAAAHARRIAGKGTSLEQVAEHSAQLRQQEDSRIQEALRKMEALKLAYLIQRGDRD